MEKEKILIRDSEKQPQMVVESDHPLYEEIKNTLMPDDYRKIMKEQSNLRSYRIEETIRFYYESIEEAEEKPDEAFLFELIPQAIFIDYSPSWECFLDQKFDVWFTEERDEDGDIPCDVTENGYEYPILKSDTPPEIREEFEKSIRKQAHEWGRFSR